MNRKVLLPLWVLLHAGCGPGAYSERDLRRQALTLHIDARANRGELNKMKLYAETLQAYRDYEDQYQDVPESGYVALLHGEALYETDQWLLASLQYSKALSLLQRQERLELQETAAYGQLYAELNALQVDTTSEAAADPAVAESVLESLGRYREGARGSSTHAEIDAFHGVLLARLGQSEDAQRVLRSVLARGDATPEMVEGATWWLEEISVRTR